LDNTGAAVRLAAGLAKGALLGKTGHEPFRNGQMQRERKIHAQFNERNHSVSEFSDIQ
jgi:hypothetical protein